MLRGLDKRVGGLIKLLVRDLCNYKARVIAQLTGFAFPEPEAVESKDDGPSDPASGAAAGSSTSAAPAPTKSAAASAIVDVETLLNSVPFDAAVFRAEGFVDVSFVPVVGSQPHATALQCRLDFVK